MESTQPHDEKGSFADPETAMGGADAVEKTSYVVGQGTDPNTLKREGVPPVGRTGPSWVLWVALGIALLIAAVYFVGIFR